MQFADDGPLGAATGDTEVSVPAVVLSVAELSVVELSVGMVV